MAKKKILVVDDELNYLFIMKHMLKEHERFEVRTTYLASQVLYVAHEFKPDLIMLDCMMPGMDGGELAGQIQNDPVLKNTPFFFLTCTVSHIEASPSKCYAGKQTYVPKDIEFDELVKLIDERLKEPEAAPT